MEAYQETSLLKSPALRQLSKFLGEHRQEWAHAMPDLETFERGLHAHLMAVERELLAEELPSTMSWLNTSPSTGSCTVSRWRRPRRT